MLGLTVKQSITLSLSANAVLLKTLPWNTALSKTETLRQLKQLFSDFDQPLVMDYQTRGKNHITVMMATLESINELCASVPKHCIIDAIDHESYAIARALKKTGSISEDTFCFYYLENNLIKLHVFENNHLIFYDEFENSEKINQYPLIENIKRVALENKSYLLTLGLTLRENTDMNLHPSFEKSQTIHRDGLKFLLKSGFYAVLLFLVAHILLTGLLFSHHAYNQYLQKKYNAVWSATSSIQTQKAQINLMNTQLQTLQQLKQQQQPSIALMQSLMHAMPEGVFLMQLSLKNNQVQLEGRSVTKEQTQTLLDNLKKITVLENPVMTPPQPDTNVPPYQFSFSVSATLGKTS